MSIRKFGPPLLIGDAMNPFPNALMILGSRPASEDKFYGSGASFFIRELAFISDGLFYAIHRKRVQNDRREFFWQDFLGFL